MNADKTLTCADCGQEFIWTESSCKFLPKQVGHLLRKAGFTPAARWIDREDQCALTLAAVV